MYTSLGTYCWHYAREFNIGDRHLKALGGVYSSPPFSLDWIWTVTASHMGNNDRDKLATDFSVIRM